VGDQKNLVINSELPESIDDLSNLGSRSISPTFAEENGHYSHKD
jgi:hypothetical protein